MGNTGLGQDTLNLASWNMEVETSNSVSTICFQFTHLKITDNKRQNDHCSKEMFATNYTTKEHKLS
jgi:hypothetical protein